MSVISKTNIHHSSHKTIYKKSLVCSCCGDRFKTWDGYEDQGRDRGYGLCLGCQNDENEREEAMFGRAIQLLANSLNQKNKKKFLSYSIEKQKLIVLRAIEEGVLKWKIG